jgi:hypothetical protein
LLLRRDLCRTFGGFHGFVVHLAKVVGAGGNDLNFAGCPCFRG